MRNEHPLSPAAAKGRRLLAISIAVTLIGYALFVIYASIKSGFDPRPALVWSIAAGLFSALWRGKTPARWLLTLLLISIIFTLGFALAENWADLLLPGMLFAAAAMLVILAFVPSISAFLRHQRAVIYPPTAAKGRSRLKVALALTFAGAATIPIVELFNSRFHPLLMICFALFVGILWAIWRGQQWARWLIATFLGIVLFCYTPLLLPDMHEPIAFGILLQWGVAFALLAFSKSISLFIADQREKHASKSMEQIEQVAGARPSPAFWP